MTHLEQLITKIKASDADAAWITNPINIYYYTGYKSEPHERLFALLAKSSGECILFCPQLEVEEAKASPFNGNIIGYLDTENPYAKYNDKFNTVLIEENHLTYRRYKELKEAFQIQDVHAVDQMIQEMRNVKSQEEINALSRAAQLADECMRIGEAFLKEGVTEREVVNHIENEIKAFGVHEMSFDTMVLFGDHAAAPHGTPGDRKLQQDEFVLFDLGVIYQNYCSDITRTIPFGNPSKEAMQVYNIVKQAETEAISKIKPGVKISDIDKTARTIIKLAGYGDYFPHRLGHGLGLEAHEYQDISETNDNLLEEGMVITVEPGVYVPGVVGVRIEDDILVTKEGHQVLSSFKK